MQISIYRFQVLSLEINSDNEIISEAEKKSFKLGYDVQYDDEREDVFSIIFDVEILHPQELSVNLKYAAWFSTENPIGDEFKNSPFPKVNAPAIAFPFLRSFISTITLNAGFKPVMLPSINFVKLSKEKEQSK